MIEDGRNYKEVVTQIQQQDWQLIDDGIIVSSNSNIVLIEAGNGDSSKLVEESVICS
jgi:hypothetical protein